MSLSGQLLFFNDAFPICIDLSAVCTMGFISKVNV